MFRNLFRPVNYLLLIAALLLAKPLSLQAYNNLEPKYNFSLITKIVAAILTGDHFKNQFKLTPYTISTELFNKYLEKLDPNHLYFTQIDIDYLKSCIKTTLFDELKEGDTTFGFTAYNLFVRKVEKRTKYAKKLLDNKFDFNIEENYDFDRTKVKWAKNENELNEVWRKKIKNDLLTIMLVDELAKEAKAEKEQKKESVDKIADTKDKKEEKTAKKKKKEKTPKEQIITKLNTYKKYLEKNKPILVLELYLNTFTHLYDPHSSYMSPHTEENFNIQMKLSFVGIGAYLSEEDGYILVERIIPGGPADKSKMLHSGDRIVGVGDKKSDIMNVIDMPISDVVKKIRGEKGTTVYLSILPAAEGIHGIPKDIKIVRGIVNLKDAEAQGKVVNSKSADGKILKIGIIDLPSFYYDFKGASEGKKNIKCSTLDVTKILKDFNKEKIDGLVIDLRANGGGSLRDAIDLTGLFIENGPVVQTKANGGDVKVENDDNASCLYKGPLLLLVSKLSASAAEIFAGAMQDYNRAIIVGDKSTHGKGTVQTVFDLSSLIKPFDFLDYKLGAIKITNAMFYRINGSSTQIRGVTPDITFNSLTDSLGIGENELDHALPWDYIDPAPHKDYKEIKPFINELNLKSIERRKDNKEFKKLDNLITLYNKIKNDKKVSLNKEKRLTKYQEEKKILKSQKEILNSTISQEEKDKDQDLDKDIFLNECVNIMSDYIEIINNPTSKKLVKKS